MRMPNIGITCYPDQGGSGVVATELGLHLARHGCEVHFITSHLPFRLRSYAANIFHHPVDLPEYPVFRSSPYTLSLASAMHDVARQHNLDILHVHYAIPHTASAYLAQQMLQPTNLKVVTTLHGTDITLVGQEPSFFPITRFLIERSDAVTTVSTFLKEETVRVFGVGADIEVIPNFVDPRIFLPDHDTELRRRLAPGGEALLLHASNFRPVKNVPAVIEVFRQVREKHPVRLVLVGDGPELKGIRRLVKEQGLEDGVVFLGVSENLEEILPVADILLLPSLHESFGLVALEAMACGVIPVATSVGGAGEFIVDGSNGFLRHPEDIAGMVEAVDRVLSQPSLKQNIAEDARRDATLDFGASCVIRQYLDLYEALLARDS